MYGLGRAICRRSGNGCVDGLSSSLVWEMVGFRAGWCVCGVCVCISYLLLLIVLDLFVLPLGGGGGGGGSGVIWKMEDGSFYYDCYQCL